MNGGTPPILKHLLRNSTGSLMKTGGVVLHYLGTITPSVMGQLKLVYHISWRTRSGNLQVSWILFEYRFQGSRAPKGKLPQDSSFNFKAPNRLVTYTPFVKCPWHGLLLGGCGLGTSIFFWYRFKGVGHLKANSPKILALGPQIDQWRKHHLSSVHDTGFYLEDAV